MARSFRTKRLIKSCGAIVLTVLFWAGLTRFLDAQASQPGTQVALEALASYTIDTGQDVTAMWLDRLGYQPAVPPQEWAQYPAQRKLAIAYLAAHHADPQRGGDRFLAALSQDLARRYDSVGATPSLEPYLSVPSPGRTVPFSNPASLPVTLDLPPRVSQAITTLAEYSASGPLGTPRTILTTHFGMPTGDVDHLLVNSRSNHEAFRRAAARLDPAGQQRAVSSWAAAVARRYDAVWHEPAIASFLSPRDGLSSGAGGAPPASPRVRSAVPVAPPASTGAAQRFQTIVRSAPGNFRAGSVRVGGLGGVMFGNDVTSRDDLVPLVLRYAPGAQASSGSLIVELSDGSVVTHRNVPAHVALVAYRLTFEAGNMVSDGDAFGLAGITDRAPAVTCDNATYRFSTGTRFNVALAPALVGTDLGWSAVAVDALPVRDQYLLSMGRRIGVEVEAALSALFQLDAPAGFTDTGTWKVVDVPTMVVREGDRLIVERAPDAAAPRPVGLRRSAFIEMRRFIRPSNWNASNRTTNGADDPYHAEFARRFYSLVPLLTQASGDYAQMNDLARVLALVRWARFKGAKFPVAPAAPAPVPTPDAILITSNGITAVKEFDPDAAIDAAEERLTACMDALEDSDPAVRQFAGRAYQALLDPSGSLMRLEDAARATPATRYWWRLFLYWVEEF